MAYATTAKILGDTTTYQLSPNVKKYSLRDTGFIETKGGKFQLERSLDPESIERPIHRSQQPYYICQS